MASFPRVAFPPGDRGHPAVQCGGSLFVGSYTYATANPRPETIPIAIVGSLPTAQSRMLESDLEDAIGSSLDITSVADRASGAEQLAEQRVFAIVEISTPNRLMTLDISSASGQAVASLLTDTLPPAAQRAGYTVTVRDLHPLQDGDPHGLTVFYMTIAAVVVGFVGAIQLGVHAAALKPGSASDSRALLSSGRAVGDLHRRPGGGHARSAVLRGLVHRGVHHVHVRHDLHDVQFADGPVGDPADLGGDDPARQPVVGRFGGVAAAAAHPGEHRWVLPPGSTVSALHTAIYFPHHQHAAPFVVLTAWTVLSTAVYLVQQRRSLAVVTAASADAAA